LTKHDVIAYPKGSKEYYGLSLEPVVVCISWTLVTPWVARPASASVLTACSSSAVLINCHTAEQDAVKCFQVYT
jgi:hypothetical protein